MDTQEDRRDDLSSRLQLARDSIQTRKNARQLQALENASEKIMSKRRRLEKPEESQKIRLGETFESQIQPQTRDYKTLISRASREYLKTHKIKIYFHCTDPFWLTNARYLEILYLTGKFFGITNPDSSLVNLWFDMMDVIYPDVTHENLYLMYQNFEDNCIFDHIAINKRRTNMNIDNLLEWNSQENDELEDVHDIDTFIERLPYMRIAKPPILIYAYFLSIIAERFPDDEFDELSELLLKVNTTFSIQQTQQPRQFKIPLLSDYTAIEGEDYGGKKIKRKTLKKIHKK